jgi:hypothetical protein
VIVIEDLHLAPLHAQAALEEVCVRRSMCAADVRRRVLVGGEIFILCWGGIIILWRSCEQTIATRRCFGDPLPLRFVVLATAWPATPVAYAGAPGGGAASTSYDGAGGGGSGGLTSTMSERLRDCFSFRLVLGTDGLRGAC